jgi:tRNA threonylcarbamoyladenosine biosynthesis protein TsaE
MTETTTSSERETAEAGAALGRTLRPGAVVLLSGPLGAGKTAFVRGLAVGLGCDPDDVSSPTFTLVQEYRGACVLQHADLYRLAPAEVDDLGLDESAEDSVLAVEWPDRWPHPPAGATAVTIEWVGESTRRITIDRLPASTPA